MCKGSEREFGKSFAQLLGWEAHWQLPPRCARLLLSAGLASLLVCVPPAPVFLLLAYALQAPPAAAPTR